MIVGCIGDCGDCDGRDSVESPDSGCCGDPKGDGWYARAAPRLGVVIVRVM